MIRCARLGIKIYDKQYNIKEFQRSWKTAQLAESVLCEIVLFMFFRNNGRQIIQGLKVIR